MLVTVITIYIAIIVRFFMLSNDNNSSKNTEFLTSDFKPTKYEARKDFSIINDYRDPFLGILPKINQKVFKSQGNQSKIVNSYYPEIHYLGVISDAKSEAKVLSLKINGKEIIIREGKTVDSVKVLSGNSNNLIVSYKGVPKAVSLFKQ